MSKALVKSKSGDFDAVIKDARSNQSQTELKQKYKNCFESYLISFNRADRSICPENS